jgi:hypothetical protein
MEPFCRNLLNHFLVKPLTLSYLSCVLNTYVTLLDKMDHR